MKKIVVILLLGAALLLVATACQPNSTPPPGTEPTARPTHPSESNSSVVEQAEEAVELVPEEVEASPEPTAVPLNEAGAAMDIPIPEDAYKYQIMRGGSSASYQVEIDIEELVSWYQEELPKYGWELAGPPDSAIGAMGTMLRENASGDRLTINMQANQLGGFVSVTIQVIRSG
jgi:hypothetical protein